LHSWRERPKFIWKPEKGIFYMEEEIKVINIEDNFGRRSGLDRRHISGSTPQKEKRGGKKRRIVKDRRSGLDRRNGLERRAPSPESDHGPENRTGRDRRSGRDRRDLLLL
jgi:hypothetical protein